VLNIVKNEYFSGALWTIISHEPERYQTILRPYSASTHRNEWIGCFTLVGRHSIGYVMVDEKCVFFGEF